MATISGGVCNTYIHMDLIVTETSVSTANNTSTLSWKLVGYMGSGGTSAHWYSNSYHTISVNINGASVYSLANTVQKSISIGTNSSQSNPVTIASGTVTVAHNNDGSKSCTCSFSCVYRYNNAFSWSGSSSIKLSSIARATQPAVSASSVDIGASITINMPRAVASFTHTLTYTFGGLSGTIGSGLGTSKVWTVPLSFANQIPSATSAKCTITCKTYNGSTVIGTKTVTFTAAVPSSAIPSISDISYDDPAGYAGKYGGFVIGKSRLKVSVTAGGVYGSKIQSYSINANGKTLTVNNSDFGIYTGGTSITATVTDSRGRGTGSSTKIPSQVILAYTAPKAAVSVCRCNSGGAADNTGAYMKVTVSGTITALNSKNAKSFEIQYKKSVESTWTKHSAYTNGYTYSATAVIAADSNYSYDVRVIAADDFETSTATASVPTAYVLIDYRYTGKGIAFGKVSEQDNFDVNMDMMLRGKLSATGALSAASAITSGSIAAGGNLYAGATTDTVTRSVYARNSLRSVRLVTNASGVIGIYNDTDAVFVLQSSTANAIQIGESSKCGSVTLSHTNGKLVANGMGIEIYGATPYVDFHFGSSTADYTSRIYEESSGVLTSKGTFRSDKNLGFGMGDAATTYAVYSKWKDGNQHNVAERNADGLSCFFGWIGSSEYATVTTLRGRTLKLQAGGNNIIPYADNTYYLGNGAYRFKQIFATNSTIATSDRNQKRDINYNLEKIEEVFDNLKPCSFYRVGGDRQHWGLVAQDVEQTLLAHGLTLDDVGLVCRDHIYTEGENNNRVYQYADDGTPMYNYGLRYEELHGIEIWQIQKLKERIANLEKLHGLDICQIQKLEKRIIDFEKKLAELAA